MIKARTEMLRLFAAEGADHWSPEASIDMYVYACVISSHICMYVISIQVTYNYSYVYTTGRRRRGRYYYCYYSGESIVDIYVYIYIYTYVCI